MPHADCVGNQRYAVPLPVCHDGAVAVLKATEKEETCKPP